MYYIFKMLAISKYWCLILHFTPWINPQLVLSTWGKCLLLPRGLCLPAAGVVYLRQVSASPLRLVSARSWCSCTFLCLDDSVMAAARIPSACSWCSLPETSVCSLPRGLCLPAAGVVYLRPVSAPPSRLVSGRSWCCLPEASVCSSLAACVCPQLVLSTWGKCLFPPWSCLPENLVTAHQCLGKLNPKFVLNMFYLILFDFLSYFMFSFIWNILIFPFLRWLVSHAGVCLHILLAHMVSAGAHQSHHDHCGYMYMVRWLCSFNFCLWLQTSFLNRGE